MTVALKNGRAWRQSAALATLPPEEKPPACAVKLSIRKKAARRREGQRGLLNGMAMTLGPAGWRRKRL